MTRLFCLVILAPYGISGILIGPVNRDIDVNLLRENWEKSYPIRHMDGLPEFVEVSTGMFRLYFRNESKNLYLNMESNQIKKGELINA